MRCSHEHVRRGQQLATKARDIKAAIAELGEMFPGSLVERFRKCGKPNCHCAPKGKRGYGPTLVVTRELRGRTITKTIPDNAVEQVRQGADEYKRFRELSRELVETSKQLGDLRLKQAVADESIKKKTALAKNFAAELQQEIELLLGRQNPEQLDPGALESTARRFDSGRSNDLLRAVHRHSDGCEEARQCFQYLHRNCDRMGYPQFEAEGFCTSSEVVKAAPSPRITIRSAAVHRRRWDSRRTRRVNSEGTASVSRAAAPSGCLPARFTLLAASPSEH